MIAPVLGEWLVPAIAGAERDLITVPINRRRSSPSAWWLVGYSLNSHRPRSCFPKLT
jgi:hypothetical protein